MHLITLIKLIELLCEDGSLKVNRVLVFWHRHKLSVDVSVIKLIYVVFVKVRIAATIVTCMLWLMLLLICVLLGLFLGLLF